LVFTGCEVNNDDPDDNNGSNNSGNNNSGNSNNGNNNSGSNNSGNSNSGNPIQLVYNTWADGVILTSSTGGQWFKFTATASAQYIHVSGGTLTGLYVQVYDNSGSTVGNEEYLSLSVYDKSVSLTLATGQEYKIRIRPYSSGSSGTYSIGFTSSTTQPRLPFPASIQLTASTWTNGNITSSSGEQWFRFTATASTQYIHVLFGSLTGLNILVYDSGGISVGSEEGLSNLRISRTLTTGQEYYIRVRPSGSGTYQISFNTTSMPPLNSSPIQLNVNIWADGVILTSSAGEQWFRFTATASMHYIHVSGGTLTGLYVQVYDNSGSTVGNEEYLSLSVYDKSVSRTLTVDQNYYIRVRPSSSGNHGTYKIAFNNSTTQPSGG